MKQTTKKVPQELWDMFIRRIENDNHGSQTSAYNFIKYLNKPETQLLLTLSMKINVLDTIKTCGPSLNCYEEEEVINKARELDELA